MKLLFSLLFLLFISPVTWANIYSLPADGGRLVGQLQTHTVAKGENLHEIGLLYGVGLLELMDANPAADPFVPTPGMRLVIPTLMLLPEVEYKGIVINLPELRLYFFHPNGKEVTVFPIGIGRVGRETPVMMTKVSSKRANPTWTPTATTRAEYAAKGEPLPAVVPAGPENPLGEYAMRLAYGHGEYLIHGTNKDFGIGMRVSAGCIRLEPANIEWLFHQVEQGEQVRIINEPIKQSVEPNGDVLIEVHSPLSKYEGQPAPKLTMTADVINFVAEHNGEKAALESIFKTMNGLPNLVGRAWEEEAEEEVDFEL
ncbi:L,D-transpeptidase family protein [Motilimonas sp. 1_MG-2023]|uniref:L,D-transpeptidase family protein n=1 Tax=Motilimonas TaxID=1914248 RepID=UPI0026E320B8|nr:L,D-transpeptidase family protein [Motilimonas sp. 1_MG-2023]MDO6524060.1 L,D-transpeptidase family protein [Motilimonas sp. 1_MG-2023]